MRLRPLAAAALAAGLAGLALAQVAPPAPASFVQIRQASLDMSVMIRGQMQAAMEAGKEAKTQAYAAFGLARWSHVLPSLFPTGSGPGETKLMTQARPEIWTDRTGFSQAAARYAEAADKLADLAKANDTPGFKAQLVVLQQACDACHARFKAGPQGPPPAKPAA